MLGWAWQANGDAFARALAGEASFIQNRRMFLDRNGYLEETFFTFFSPIRDETGGVGGLVHPVTETTAKMICERRTRTVRDVASRSSRARTMEDGLSLAAETLAESDLDLPFTPFAADRSTGGAEEPAAPECVLVAHDNADMREYLRRPLAGRYDVEAVADGQAALEATRRSRPALVLTDVMMPRLDGVGLVKHLKADPKLQTVPVLVLTARAGEEATGEGLESGADDYLVKPFSAREFLARVRTHLNHARAHREWATALESANADLEAFAPSVSHDLHAPLRYVVQFAELLASGLAAKLGDKERHYLETIRRSAEEAGRLVDDLLSFARMARADLQSARVDMGELVREVQQRLARDAAGREVLWTVAELPEVRGDRDMLRLVLENLLSNALKYARGRSPARIEVGSALRDGDSVFFVRDNGVGVDMRRAGKLFQVFQRLHRPTEFEGTGVGLANVRRIVLRHGGEVWAHAPVGQGATPYFTLPAPRGAGVFTSWR